MPLNDKTRFENAGKIGSIKGITRSLISHDLDNYTKGRLNEIMKTLESIEL